MKDSHHIIQSQVISEKGTDLASANNQYLFRVAPKANKIEIKRAVEQIFGVKVRSVRVMNRQGKTRRRGLFSGRTSGSRRAIVRLKQGETINLT